MASADVPWSARLIGQRMVVIVCRNSLEHDVLEVLRETGIESFTDLPEVHGRGETGGAFQSFEWRAANTMIFTVIDAPSTVRLLTALMRLRQRAVAAGGVMPLRAFVLPCAQAM